MERKSKDYSIENDRQYGNSEKCRNTHIKRDISSKYSRFHLSKTAKSVQVNGTKSLSISENSKDGDDGKLEVAKIKSKFQLKKMKCRTNTFWDLPISVKSGFIETSNSKDYFKIVTNSINFTNRKSKVDNRWCTKLCNFQEKRTLDDDEQKITTTLVMTDEITSRISLKGNVMSMVIRKKFEDENSDSDIAVPLNMPFPSINSNILRNINRSINFWSSYHNFILCNRTIELRITKLLSFENIQYILDYSANVFKNRSINGIPVTKVKSFERYYIVELIKYELSNCMFEKVTAEHIITHQQILVLNCIVKPDIRPNENTIRFNSVKVFTENQFESENEEVFRTDKLTTTMHFNPETVDNPLVAPLVDESHVAKLNEHKDYYGFNCSNFHNKSDALNRSGRFAIKISGLFLSLWVIYLSLINYSYN